VNFTKDERHLQIENEARSRRVTHESIEPQMDIEDQRISMLFLFFYLFIV
jgi:hypothetical protein